MLRIDEDRTGCVTRLRLSGRIQSEDIAWIESALSGSCPRKVLDLGDVTLADLGVIQFLIRCEDEGIQLDHCPSYVREWILRERTE